MPLCKDTENLTVKEAQWSTFLQKQQRTKLKELASEELP